MQDQENEKDVGGKGKIVVEVFKNKHPTRNLAGAQSHEGEGQGQEENEPKKIKSSNNKVGANWQTVHEA
jgi:hypothetical protein